MLKGSTPKSRQRINQPANDSASQLTDETIELFNSQSQEEEDTQHIGDTPEVEDVHSKSILEEIDEVKALGNDIESNLRQNETEVEYGARSDADKDADKDADEEVDEDADEDASDKTPGKDANERILRLIMQLEFHGSSH